MTCVGLARHCASGVFLCLLLSGCLPAADNQSDETKEPHFIAGKNLVGAMDYQGAIEAFEQALEVNPRSASAHFELGWLYEEKADDPAAAIYHYERYLKFSANPDRGELARQHIISCKLELAKTVSAIGTQPAPAQRELERLTQENQELQARAASLQWQLNQLRASSTRSTAAPAAPTPIPAPVPRAESPHLASMRPPAVPPRTYTVKAGDTPIAIAKKCGVSVNALMAANPQARPTHLMVGQTLNLPAP